MLAWRFASILIAFTYSFHKPLFQPRYFVICLPPLVLLGGAGLCGIERESGWVFVVSPTAMILLSAGGLINWYKGSDKAGGQDRRQATGYVLSRGQAGDTIFFEPPDASVPFNYYLHRLNKKGKISETAWQSSEIYVTSIFQRGRRPDFDDKSLALLQTQYQRIWLVGRNLPQPKNERTIMIQRLLKRKYRLIESTKFKKITVLLYRIVPV